VFRKQRIGKIEDIINKDMDNINNAIIKKLNHLIATSSYSQNNYTNAAENVKNEALKKSFQQYAKERALDISELKLIIKSLGSFHEEDVGVPNNKEMKIRSAFIDIDENSLINKCVLSDDNVIDAYNEALSGNAIFGSIKDILIYQLSGIKNAIKDIRIYSRKVS